MEYTRDEADTLKAMMHGKFDNDKDFALHILLDNEKMLPYEDTGIVKIFLARRIQNKATTIFTKVITSNNTVNSIFNSNMNGTFSFTIYSGLTQIGKNPSEIQVLHSMTDEVSKLIRDDPEVKRIEQLLWKYRFRAHRVAHNNFQI